MIDASVAPSMVPAYTTAIVLVSLSFAIALVIWTSVRGAIKWQRRHEASGRYEVGGKKQTRRERKEKAEERRLQETKERWRHEEEMERIRLQALNEWPSPARLLEYDEVLDSESKSA